MWETVHTITAVSRQRVGLTRGRKAYLAFAWLALLWSVGNCLYVYVIRAGGFMFRLESAVYILAGVLLPLLFWRRSQAAPAETLGPLECRGLMLAASVLWLITIAPLIQFPFLSDDYVFLTSYAHWSDVFRFAQFFRPLFGGTFHLLSRLGQGSVVPFHLAAFVIHAVSAAMVFVLARRFFRRDDAAALSFAMFLLNPLQLEAVLWTSGLQELLWTAFLLSGLIVYTGRQVLTPARIAAATSLLACGLLAKESAIAWVLLAPAADWVGYRMKRGGLLAAAYGSFAVTGLAYLIVRAQVTSIDPGFFATPGTYFVKQLVGAPYRFFVQPWNSLAAPLSPYLLCAVSAVAIVLLFRAVLRGAGPTILAGPTVILFTTLPVYSYFYVAPDLRGARYLYFAAAGWALLTGHVLGSSFTRRQTIGVAFVAVVVLSFASLRLNLRPWRTAAEIVTSVQASVREGRPADALEWQRRYGPGLEMKGDVPYVYEGVYLFVNGYPELQQMLAATK